MKLKTGTPIEVTWVDTHGTAGWQTIEDFPPPPVIKTLGFFVGEKYEGIYLASGLADSLDGEVLAPCWIPNGTIQKIRKLR